MVAKICIVVLGMFIAKTVIAHQVRGASHPKQRRLMKEGTMSKGAKESKKSDESKKSKWSKGDLNATDSQFLQGGELCQIVKSMYKNCGDHGAFVFVDRSGTNGSSICVNEY